jgi:hypothetical protein
MATKNAPVRRDEGALCSSSGSNGSVYSTALVARHIEITEEAFGCGFDVVVKPQIVADNQGWEFATHTQAMEWAKSLGLPIVDKTGARA